MEFSTIISAIVIIILIIIFVALVYFKFTESGTRKFNEWVPQTGWTAWLYTILGIEQLKKSGFCGNGVCDGTGGEY